MCNDVGDPIRLGTLTNTKKGLNRLSMKLQHIKGMASPTGKKIMKDITNSIKDITRNLCPANTHLFNVEFED